MQKNAEEPKEGNEGSVTAGDEEAQRLITGVNDEDELDVDGDRVPAQGR